MGYKESRVVLPSGFNRAQMKMQVRCAEYLGANEKCLIHFVLDQAETYRCIGVSQIKKELVWGEKRWIKTRDLLSKKGIYRGYGLINARGSIDWKMVFDFNEFEYQKEGITSAHTIPPVCEDHPRSIPDVGITCDRAVRGGSVPNVLTKKIPQPPRKVVVVIENKGQKDQKSVDQEEQPGSQLHWPPGLTEAQVESIGMSLVNQGRCQELLDELAGRMSSCVPVRDPVAVLRKLAKLASDGSLVCDLAEGIRTLREGRQAHQQRLETLSALGYPTVRSAPKSFVPVPQSSAVLQARAALRTQRARWGPSK